MHPPALVPKQRDGKEPSDEKDRQTDISGSSGRGNCLYGGGNCAGARGERLPPELAPGSGAGHQQAGDAAGGGGAVDRCADPARALDRCPQEKPGAGQVPGGGSRAGRPRKGQEEPEKTHGETGGCGRQNSPQGRCGTSARSLCGGGHSAQERNHAHARRCAGRFPRRPDDAHAGRFPHRPHHAHACR